jgi:hypothetical protein
MARPIDVVRARRIAWLGLSCPLMDFAGAYGRRLAASATSRRWRATSARERGLVARAAGSGWRGGACERDGRARDRHRRDRSSPPIDVNARFDRRNAPVHRAPPGALSTGSGARRRRPLAPVVEGRRRRTRLCGRFSSPQLGHSWNVLATDSA